MKKLIIYILLFSAVSYFVNPPYFKKMYAKFTNTTKVHPQLSHPNSQRDSLDINKKAQPLAKGEKQQFATHLFSTPPTKPKINWFPEEPLLPHVKKRLDKMKYEESRKYEHRQVDLKYDPIQKGYLLISTNKRWYFPAKADTFDYLVTRIDNKEKLSDTEIAKLLQQKEIFARLNGQGETFRIPTFSTFTPIPLAERLLRDEKYRREDELKHIKSKVH